jgi:hypothetical protein
MAHADFAQKQEARAELVDVFPENGALFVIRQERRPAVD